jgi:hypothetical protein
MTLILLTYLTFQSLLRHINSYIFVIFHSLKMEKMYVQEKLLWCCCVI